jgi:hypothetical protein
MAILVGLLFFVAFAGLGVLVGALAGLSASPIASALVGLSFSLIGGSILNLFSRLTVTDRVYALLGLTAFSLATLCGLGGGIYVSEYRLLTPPEHREAATTENRYLRSVDMSCINGVDVQVTAGQITREEGYDRILSDCALAAP